MPTGGRVHCLALIVVLGAATACGRRETPTQPGPTAAGKLILASYVNGAPWAQGAWKGVKSATYSLERWVTYNEGLSGASVHPTYRFGPRPQPSNRGDMSQHGADALAARGYRWPGILRFFYGADLEVTLPEPADPRGLRGSESTSSSSSSAGPLVLAAVLAAYGATRGFS